MLTYADQGNESRAREMLPTVVEQDWDIDDRPQAELRMREAVGELINIRRQYDLPQVCA